MRTTKDDTYDKQLVNLVILNGTQKDLQLKLWKHNYPISSPRAGVAHGHESVDVTKRQKTRDILCFDTIPRPAHGFKCRILEDVCYHVIMRDHNSFLR